MQDLIKNLTNFDDVTALIVPEAAIYLVVVLLLFTLGKVVYDKTNSYNLSHELTEVDNKAVAISFAGYLFALGLIIWGVMTSDSAASTGDSKRELLSDIVNTGLWGCIGIVLLQVSRFINDKFILHQFNNTKELVEDKNIGTGAVQMGSYIGTGLLIKAVLSGEAHRFTEDFIATLIYFVIGQVAFIVFGILYQKTTRFDVHKEIEKDNPAAGVSFGINLIAVGIILATYLEHSDSVYGLIVWFAISSLVLITARYAVDKLILPGHLLDEEISKDHNWGAALVEGAVALSLAMLLMPLFT